MVLVCLGSWQLALSWTQSSKDKPLLITSWLQSPNMETLRVYAVWIQAVLCHLENWQIQRKVEVGRGPWRSPAQESSLGCTHYAYHGLTIKQLFLPHYFSFLQLEHCFGLSQISLLQQGMVQDWSPGTLTQPSNWGVSYFPVGSCSPGFGSLQMECVVTNRSTYAAFGALFTSLQDHTVHNSQREHRRDSC